MRLRKGKPTTPRSKSKVFLAHGGPWDGQRITLDANIMYTLTFRIGEYFGRYVREAGYIRWVQAVRHG